MKKIKKTTVLVAAITSLFGTVAMAQCDITNTGPWGQTNNPTNKLDITAVAAMGGTTCGMEIEVTNQNTQANKHFLQDGSPTAETRYRAAFCVDVNTLPMATTGSNRRIKVMQAQCGGGTCANSDIVEFKVELTPANQYRLEVFARNLGEPNNKLREQHDIPDAPTRVEFDIDLTSGDFRVWINATAESDTPVIDTTLDTSLWPVITRARFGSMDKSNNAGQGSNFYLDEFESRRQTFIGGTCN